MASRAPSRIWSMLRPPLKLAAQTATRPDATADEAELLRLEALYCSHGDTVHYTDPPKIFERCEGSFIYDGAGCEYLDLQMWYSAVNFGYANRRLNDPLNPHIDRLPHLASQYLHLAN